MPNKIFQSKRYPKSASIFYQYKVIFFDVTIIQYIKSIWKKLKIGIFTLF
jgi:hypothetical protein